VVLARATGVGDPQVKEAVRRTSAVRVSTATAMAALPAGSSARIAGNAPGRLASGRAATTHRGFG
jgi:hypothetical protein